MSFAVVRGEATAAQRFLDAELAAAGRFWEARRQAARRQAARTQPSHLPLNLAQILYYSLQNAPEQLFMVNCKTGEEITNAEILERSVQVGRALRARWAGARGAEGRTPRLLGVVRNNQHTVSLLLGALFAGLPLMFIDPASTKFELEHFLRLLEPCAVFCDDALQAPIRAAISAVGAPDVVGGAQDAADGLSPPLFVVDNEEFQHFSAEYRDVKDIFIIEDSAPGDTILLLPTSGSTGFPKAAMLTNGGYVAQLPFLWRDHSRFPRPTRRALVLTTPQWVTCSMLLATCAVFRVPLLLSPAPPSVQHVLHVLKTFRPTWTFFGPAFAKSLAIEATPDHFSSLETVITLGSQATPDVIAALQKVMAPNSNYLDGYGMTEMQGFIALQDVDAPTNSLGRINNIIDYKIVKDDGDEAATDEEGELWVKSPYMIPGYWRNEQELGASLAPGGWLRTGDAVTRDAQRRIHYRRRIKFTFKYNNQNVSPEEVEQVVAGVEGVAQCAVVGAARGPAAALVLRPGADPRAVRADVHRAVDAALSDHKRLRGGIAFVAAERLPRTHSGKLQRQAALGLLEQLIRDGDCY